MRVVLAACDPVPAPKGASAHIQRNLEVLRADHEVSLVTLGDEPLPGARHLVVRPEGSNWLERAVDFHHRCRSIFRRHAFDAHHVRSPFEGLAAPGPVLYEVNALYSVEMPYHYPALVERPEFRDHMRALEVTLLERAEALITPSPVTAAYLGDLGFPDAAVVPNAPSIPLRPAPSHDGPRIELVYLGTLAPWQGLRTALEVLGRLTHLDWHLTVLTGARKRRWVDKLADKRGIAERVTVRDALAPDALADLLQTADLGLAPLTPSERNLVQGCMPIKVLDYLRAGLPVVAPDLPVVRELVGDDAPLYRPWSRQSLTEVLEHWMTTDRRAQAAAGRARVEACFSEAVQAAALRSVYAAL